MIHANHLPAARIAIAALLITMQYALVNLITLAVHRHAGQNA